MKKIIILNLFLFLGLSANAQQLIDRVIAQVGSENVLLSDVEGQHAYIKLQGQEISKCSVMKEIIAQKLIIYQAKLDSISVSDAEVDQQLDFKFDRILAQMGGDEEMFKEYYGQTVKQMKEDRRDDQKHQILAQRMQQNLINSIEITPKEVRTYFDRIPKDSIPYLGSEVELGELVMKPILTEDEKNLAKNKLQGLLEQIKNGESFEKLALAHSQDPGSGSRGGDLGFAKRGTYVPEFEATVYNLSKGEVSDVIETEFGFHIIKLVERRGNAVRAKHILIKPEITQASVDRTIAKLDSVKTLIESDSLSFSKAVREYGFDKAQSFSNNGKMKNQATGNNFFQTDNLEPDIYFDVVDLKVNGVTAPKEYTTVRGEKQFRIIQLQSMTSPHQANLQQDYDKISQYAKESKKAEYFNEWVEKKMRSSYIKIDPQFACPEIDALIN